MAQAQAPSQAFNAEPRPVVPRQKYREGSINVMYDRRVFRGSTYTTVMQPKEDAATIQKQREAQRRRLMRANKTKRRVSTPEAVMGRKHVDIQTDSYLEELTDRTVEFEAEAQTDFLLDRPQSPLFMPAKIGLDTFTQIEEGELFDFDREVEPVLEVMVGKTLEQAMMEVLEEEEIANIVRHQEEFEARRQAELLEVQRMESAEVRRQEEQERRMAQERSRRVFDQAVARKVKARNFARVFLAGLQERALDEVANKGGFADPVVSVVEGIFMPWLVDAVSATIQKQGVYQNVVDEFIDSAVSSAINEQEQAMNAIRRKVDEAESAERRLRAEVDEMKALKKREAERIAKEKDCMASWAQAEEESSDERVIVSVKEDGRSAQVIVPESQDGVAEEMADIPSTMVEEVRALMEKASEGGSVKAWVSLGTVVRVEFVAPEQESEQVEAPEADAEAAEGEVAEEEG